MNKIYVFVILVVLVGCGYSIRRDSDLPFSEVQIISIVNRTSEPNIEDIFHEKLAVEFMKQGISVKNLSRYSISGEIREFTLRVVSEKNEFSREYEVIIRSSFTLKGPDNFIKKLQNIQSPFIESFIATRNLNSIISFKEVAVEQALASLSRRIVSETIYK